MLSDIHIQSRETLSEDSSLVTTSPLGTNVPADYTNNYHILFLWTCLSTSLGGNDVVLGCFALPVVGNLTVQPGIFDKFDLFSEMTDFRFSAPALGTLNPEDPNYPTHAHSL